MILDSPFTLGGTVQAGRGIYLQREVDEELLARCRTNTYAYLLASRQEGKSSLMVSTAERLRAEGILTATVDLSQLGENSTIEQWMFGIVRAISKQLGIESSALPWWRENSDLSPSSRFVRFCTEVALHALDGRAVVFLDEIDTTVGVNFADDLFVAIRALYNSRAETPDLQRLSFVLIGVAAPNELIRDKDRTPFNIGVRVSMRDFTWDEASPLIQKLGLQAGEAKHTLQQILWWTGGHPYLTMRLCEEVHLQSLSGQAVPVEQSVRRLFLSVEGEQDSNITFVRDMLVSKAPAGLSGDVLLAYRKALRNRFWDRLRDEERSVVVSHLKKSGVVRSRGGFLHVRNRIYARVFDGAWVSEHLVIDWRRRLARAARAATLVLLGLSVPLGAYAWHQAMQATANFRQANSNAIEAQKQKNRAVANFYKAQEQARIVSERENEAQGLTRELDLANKRLSVALADATRTIAEKDHLALEKKALEKKLADQQMNYERSDQYQIFRVIEDAPALGDGYDVTEPWVRTLACSNHLKEALEAADRNSGPNLRAVAFLARAQVLEKKGDHRAAENSRQRAVAEAKRAGLPFMDELRTSADQDLARELQEKAPPGLGPYDRQRAQISSFIRQGRLDEVSPFLEELKQYESKSGAGSSDDLRSDLALAYINFGNLKDASSAIATIRYDQNRVKPTVALAEAYAAAKQLEKAAAAWDEAIRLASDDDHQLFYVGTELEKAGDTKRLPPILEKLAQWPVRQPTNGYDVGKGLNTPSELAKLGDLPGAIRKSSKFPELGLAWLSEPAIAKAQYRQAQLLLSGYPEPFRSQGLLALAQGLLESGASEAAMAMVQGAKSPSMQAKQYELKFSVLVILGRFDEAVQSLAKCNDDSLRSQAIVSQAQNVLGERAFKGLVKVAEGCRNAYHRSLALLALAEAEAKSGRTHSAAALFDEAVASSAEIPVSYWGPKSMQLDIVEREANYVAGDPSGSIATSAERNAFRIRDVFSRVAGLSRVAETLSQIGRVNRAKELFQYALDDIQRLSNKSEAATSIAGCMARARLFAWARATINRPYVTPKDRLSTYTEILRVYAGLPPQQ